MAAVQWDPAMARLGGEPTATVRHASDMGGEPTAAVHHTSDVGCGRPAACCVIEESEPCLECWPVIWELFTRFW